MARSLSRPLLLVAAFLALGVQAEASARKLRLRRVLAADGPEKQEEGGGKAVLPFKVSSENRDAILKAVFDVDDLFPFADVLAWAFNLKDSTAASLNEGTTAMTDTAKKVLEVVDQFQTMITPEKWAEKDPISKGLKNLVTGRINHTQVVIDNKRRRQEMRLNNKKKHDEDVANRPTPPPKQTREELAREAETRALLRREIQHATSWLLAGAGSENKSVKSASILSFPIEQSVIPGIMSFRRQRGHNIRMAVDEAVNGSYQEISRFTSTNFSNQSMLVDYFKDKPQQLVQFLDHLGYHRPAGLLNLSMSLTSEVVKLLDDTEDRGGLNVEGMGRFLVQLSKSKALNTEMESGMMDVLLDWPNEEKKVAYNKDTKKVQNIEPGTMGIVTRTDDGQTIQTFSSKDVIGTGGKFMAEMAGLGRLLSVAGSRRGNTSKDLLASMETELGTKTDSLKAAPFIADIFFLLLDINDLSKRKDNLTELVAGTKSLVKTYMPEDKATLRDSISSTIDLTMDMGTFISQQMAAVSGNTTSHPEAVFLGKLVNKAGDIPTEPLDGVDRALQWVFLFACSFDSVAEKRPYCAEFQGEKGLRLFKARLHAAVDANSSDAEPVVEAVQEAAELDPLKKLHDLSDDAALVQRSLSVERRPAFPAAQLESWAVNHFEGLDDKLVMMKTMLNVSKAVNWFFEPKRFEFFTGVARGVRNLLSSPNSTHMRKLAEEKKRRAEEHQARHDQMQELKLEKKRAAKRERELEREMRTARRNGTFHRKPVEHKKPVTHEKPEKKKPERMSLEDRQQEKLARVKIGKALDRILSLGNLLPSAARTPISMLLVDDIMKLVKHSGTRGRKLVAQLVNISAPEMNVNMSEILKANRTALMEVAEALPSAVSEVVEAFRTAGFTMLPRIADFMHYNLTPHFDLWNHVSMEGKRLAKANHTELSRGAAARLLREAASLRLLPPFASTLVEVLSHTAGLLEGTDLPIKAFSEKLAAGGDQCNADLVRVVTGVANALALEVDGRSQKDLTRLIKKSAKVLIAMENCPNLIPMKAHTKEVYEEWASLLYLSADFEVLYVPDVVKHIANLASLSGLNLESVGLVLDELLAFVCTLSSSEEHVAACKEIGVHTEVPATDSEMTDLEGATPAAERAPAAEAAPAAAPAATVAQAAKLKAHVQDARAARLGKAAAKRKPPQGRREEGKSGGKAAAKRKPPPSRAV